MGSMFGNLTKTGVSSDQGTKYFDSKPEAAMEFAKQSTAPVQAYDLSQKTIGGDEATPLTTVQEGSQQKFVNPSFSEAKPEQLTTKGKVLGGLLQLAGGAAIGAGRRTFGEGFQAAQEFPVEMERRREANRLAQQEEIIRQNTIAQQPQLFKLGVQEKTANIKRDAAAADYYTAGAGKRDKTKADLDKEAQDAADASGYAKGSREYNQIRFGNPLDVKQDTSRSAYEDFRAKYPDTPEGRAQSATDWLKLEKTQKPSRAEQVDDLKAQAELLAVDYINDAKGDPNAALKLVDQELRSAKGSAKEKQAARLAQFIRDSLRERSRINTGAKTQADIQYTK
jgi:hypothetical protein